MSLFATNQSKNSNFVCLQSPSCRVPRRRRLKDAMGSGDENERESALSLAQGGGKKSDPGNKVDQNSPLTTWSVLAWISSIWWCSKINFLSSFSSLNPRLNILTEI